MANVGSKAVKGSSTTPAIAPALVLAGLDLGGRAHASWFGADQVEGARAAAEESGLSAMPVDSPVMIDIANRLPKGKLYESGKAFVPFVAGALFQELVAQVPADVRNAFITKPDDPAAVTDEEQAIIDGAEPARDWGKLKAGSLVLAHDGEAWYEAVVIKVVKETDTLALRFRDYPDDGVVFHKRSAVGMPPAVMPSVG